MKGEISEKSKVKSQKSKVKGQRSEVRSILFQLILELNFRVMTFEL